MRHIILVLTSCILNLCLIQAQNITSFKGHVKAAEKYASESNTAEAAFHFEAAWALKTTRTDILALAADNFFSARDYTKAAALYGILLNDKKFAASRLNYARALQQSGAYDEALPEFLQYSSTYEGTDREKVLDRIESYVEGCTKGIVLTDQAKKETNPLVLSHLNFNTTKNDVNPFFFNDDILYFSQQSSKDTTIVRSQWQNEDWSGTQEIPALRNLLVGRAIIQGSFANNGSDFYFSAPETAFKNKKPIKSIFIYHVQKTNSGWSVPEKLSERINIEGGVATQPFVFKKYDTEWLFFASNRPGGRGGMDIWWTKRTPSITATVFDAPQNCGSIINTDGDETTPFYDTKKGELYFASNGRPTLGGLDIFKSKGFLNKWYSPENLGIPFNSPADDQSFILSSDGAQCYFVSNRMLGAEKLNSLDDDIYSVALNTEQKYELKGVIQETVAHTKIKNARVALFEKTDKGRRLLVSTICAESVFNYPIFPNKQYTLEIEADSFIRQSLNIVTNFDHMVYDQNIALQRSKMPVIVADLPTPETIVATSSIPESKPIVTVAKNTSAPNPKQVGTKNNTSKVAYKVQVLAYESPDYTNQRRLQRVEDLGELDTERATINGKIYTRVLLKSEGTYNEAQNILKKVKSRSLFDAFIVRYENGQRADK